MKILIPRILRDNIEMADIREEYKIKKQTGNRVATKRKPVVNQFKANVSKKSRQEWGDRMNHLRSIK